MLTQESERPGRNLPRDFAREALRYHSPSPGRMTHERAAGPDVADPRQHGADRDRDAGRGPGGGPVHARADARVAAAVPMVHHRRPAPRGPARRGPAAVAARRHHHPAHHPHDGPARHPPAARFPPLPGLRHHPAHGARADRPPRLQGTHAGAGGRQDRAARGPRTPGRALLAALARREGAAQAGAGRSRAVHARTRRQARGSGPGRAEDDRAQPARAFHDGGAPAGAAPHFPRRRDQPERPARAGEAQVRAAQQERPPALRIRHRALRRRGGPDAPEGLGEPAPRRLHQRIAAGGTGPAQGHAAAGRAGLRQVAGGQGGGGRLRRAAGAAGLRHAVQQVPRRDREEPARRAVVGRTDRAVRAVD